MPRLTDFELPRALWERLRERPGRVPELIALAAAETFGPQAQRWVENQPRWRRSPKSRARKACRKHVRLARLEGATLGIGGAVTASLDLGALAWIQARMVFYVAAAHGFDPTHPMRPAELLALWEIYPTPAEAREALDGVGKPLAQALAESQLAGRDQAITETLLRFVGRRLMRRFAGRGLPLISAPIAAIQNGAATKELGRRTLAYYGGET
jgi:uncharacterized protein (DUF697 family)